MRDSKYKTKQVGIYTLLAGDKLTEEIAARKESGVQGTQGAWLQFPKEWTLEQRYEGGEGGSGPGRRRGRNEGPRAGGGGRRVWEMGSEVVWGPQGLPRVRLLPRWSHGLVRLA